MFEVHKDGILIKKFDTLVEAMEFANADAEIHDHGELEWDQVGDDLY